MNKEALAVYLRDEVLRSTASFLKWDNIENYDSIIKPTLRKLGIVNVEDALDEALLEVVAQVEVWKAVKADTLTRNDIEEFGFKVKMSDIFKRADEMLNTAKNKYTSYTGLDYDNGGSDSSSSYYPLSGSMPPVSRF